MKLRELQLGQDYFVHNTRRGPRRYHHRFRVTRIDRVTDDKSFKQVKGVMLDDAGTRPISGTITIKPKDLLYTWEHHLEAQRIRSEMGRLHNAVEVVLLSQKEKVKNQILEAVTAKLAALGHDVHSHRLTHTYSDTFTLTLEQTAALLEFTPPSLEKLNAIKKAADIASAAHSLGRELTAEEKEDPVIKKILALPPFNNTTSTASTAGSITTIAIDAANTSTSDTTVSLDIETNRTA